MGYWCDMGLLSEKKNREINVFLKNVYILTGVNILQKAVTFVTE